MTDRHRERHLVRTATPGWPEPLRPAALHGLLGDIVNTIDPYTEADPAAVACQVSVAFGNAIGRRAHFTVEADRHSANLFVALVGRSARGRKGTSRGYVSEMFRHVDTQWAKECVQTGLSSGEGLVQAVADNNVDVAASGKRLMVYEDEFSSVLRNMSRWGNTLSTTLRNLWDGRPLQLITRGDPLRVFGAHISIVAHTTQYDLDRYLNQTDIFNGFANRFLWPCVQRSKLLPDGGGIPKEKLSSLSRHLKDSVEFARRQREIGLSTTAAALWKDRYPALTAEIPGFVGAVTSRAEAQVRRLALIYALMNQSSTVRTKHLRAAFEVWRFCEDSARFIFGGRSAVTLEDKILVHLRREETGLTRTQISQALQHHESSEDILGPSMSYEKESSFADDPPKPVGVPQKCGSQNPRRITVMIPDAVREERLLTINEVSELTGLAVGTLYHFVSQRRIPVVRLSKRCIRFRQSDLSEWIQTLSQEAR